VFTWLSSLQLRFCFCLLVTAILAIILTPIILKNTGKM
jgi:hypothetical protein